MQKIIQYLKNNPICIKISQIIHWDDLKAFKIKLRNYTFNFPEIKPKFYLPYYKNDYIQKKIYESHNYFEFKNLDYVCKKWNKGTIGNYIQGKSILDIGTNIGNHTLYFFFECQIKDAYNFEPVENTLNIFKKNIYINNLSNKVHIYNVAVGQSEGKADIYSYNKDNIGATKIKPQSDGAIQVITIDSLNIQETIGLIKIDVEGFETNVLKGALNTLKKNMPYILIEIVDENFEEIHNLLSNIGYSYEKLDSFETYADYLFFK